MTNQKEYFIEQVGKMQAEGYSYKLTGYGIALKQVLFYMKNNSLKEDYYKELNRYFMIKSINNDNAVEILEHALQQHKEDLEALQM